MLLIKIVKMVLVVEDVLVTFLIISEQSRQSTQSGLISFYLKSYYVFNVIQLPSFAGLDSYSLLSSTWSAI